MFQDSVVYIMSKLTVQLSRFRNSVGAKIFSSAKYLDSPLGPTRLIFSASTNIFPLTTHFHLVPGLRMGGAVTSLPLCGFMIFAGTTVLYLYPYFCLYFLNSYSYIFNLSSFCAFAVCMYHALNKNALYVCLHVVQFCNLTSVHFSVCHVSRNFMEFI